MHTRFDHERFFFLVMTISVLLFFCSFVEWQCFKTAFYWGTGTDDIKSLFVCVFVIEVRMSSSHLSRWTMNLCVECSLEAEHLQSSNINPMFPQTLIGAFVGCVSCCSHWKQSSSLQTYFES